ncbi:MAG: type II 3-dehydroquinate dehydratase [Micrococcus sp.]|nr:type II 3-dehydroquinate dehydratase [Micrococcus sp.]
MSAHGTVYVLNGPNLNLLGSREPEVYGTDTLDDVRALTEREAAEVGLTVEFRQSNHEGVLIDWIHEAREHGVGIILNPGAFTHTSIAIRDALSAAELPAVEVHLSNVHAREAFRAHSYISPVVRGVIAGTGVRGYAYAIREIAALTG